MQNLVNIVHLKQLMKKVFKHSLPPDHSAAPATGGSSLLNQLILHYPQACHIRLSQAKPLDGQALLAAAAHRTRSNPTTVRTDSTFG
jgi:hypothetical protein